MVTFISNFYIISKYVYFLIKIVCTDFTYDSSAKHRTIIWVDEFDLSSYSLAQRLTTFLSIFIHFQNFTFSIQRLSDKAIKRKVIGLGVPLRSSRAIVKKHQDTNIKLQIILKIQTAITVCCPMLGTRVFYY